MIAHLLQCPACQHGLSWCRQGQRLWRDLRAKKLAGLGAMVRALGDREGERRALAPLAQYDPRFQQERGRR